MKRAAIALAGGLLIAALLPGSALGTPITGSLDQSNAAGTQKVAAGKNNPTTGNRFIQTFTAGKTGILTAVALWETDQDVISVSIYPMVAGKPDVSGYSIGNGMGEATDTTGWVYFSMDVDAPPVMAGTQYAIAIYIPDFGTDHNLFGSGDTYSGGEALFQTGPSTFEPVSATFKDFAFQTYVDPQTTALTWSKTQLTAGSPTQLTLSETFVLPTYGMYVGVVPALDPGINAFPTIKVDMAPAWFVATIIECSSQIAKADCKLSNEAPGPGFPVMPDGDPVTIELRGLASPTAADTGSFPAAARGCMGYVGLVELASCVEGRAAVVVVGPGATPPPTTASVPPSKDSGLPLLFVACFAAAACGMILTIGRRARRSS